MTLTAPHLRPLTLGELLDRAIGLYRQNFPEFIGIIAFIQIPLTLLTLLFSGQAEAGQMGAVSMLGVLFNVVFFSDTANAYWLLIIGFILIQGVVTAALTQAAASSYLGEPVTITGAYRQMGRTWLSLLGALFLAAFFIIAIVLWSMVPCAGSLTGLGLFLFFVMVVVPLLAPVVVLEKQSPGRAIRRAWDLARRRFWWVFSFVFILFVFGQVAVMGPAALINYAFELLIGDAFTSLETQETVQAVVNLLVQLLSILIFLPLQLIAITLMYFDLRIRTEGLDLALSAESIITQAPEMIDIVAHTPQTRSEKWLTSQDVGSFVLFSVGSVGGCVGLTFLSTTLLALLGAMIEVLS